MERKNHQNKHIFTFEEKTHQERTYLQKTTIYQSNQPNELIYQLKERIFYLMIDFISYLVGQLQFFDDKTGGNRWHL